MNAIKKSMLLVLSITVLSQIIVHAQLNVSANGHFLVQENGKPFFRLGDTGWGLLQKIDIR